MGENLTRQGSFTVPEEGQQQQVVEAAPEQQVASDPGFPANTPWQQMAPEQQVKYWMHQSRKHEARASAVPANLDELQAAAAELAQVRQSQMNETQKAIEAAKAEGRSSAISEAGTKAAAAIYAANLQARGKDAEAVAIARKAFNAAAFLDGKTGEVDTDGIAAFVSQLYGPTGAYAGAQQHQWPATGQGNYQAPQTKPGAAGLAEAEKRFGKKAS